MSETRRISATRRVLWLLAAALALVFSGCDDSSDDDGAQEQADGAENAGAPASTTSVTIVTEAPEGICHLGAAPFGATVDNPWFPLPAGEVAELRGEEDGEKVYLRLTVATDTVEIAGVATRMLEEYEEHDGEVVEISHNYFAQALDGTVCYFGEDVDIYENGAVVGHDGAWRAGNGVNQPGIQMPAHPEPGMSYAQELAPGLAEDHADHVAAGEHTETPYADFDDTLSVREWSTLEPDDQSTKVYGYGVGLLIDDGLALETVTVP